MSVLEAFTGIETVGTAEWSMTTDTAGPDVDTTAGDYQAFIDVSAMVAGDEFEWRAYEKTRSGDTQRVVMLARMAGVQSTPIWVSPSLKLLNGWDMTLKKIAGTDRSITWSIRKSAAASLGADAITASSLAADAIAEIQSGLALSTQVDALEAAAIAIVADTEDIQARLPAALVSGRIDASVGAMAANTMTAAAAAADLATELQSGLALSTQVDALEGGLVTALADLDDIQTRLPAALVSGRIDASVGAMAANVMTAAAAAADLTTELQTGVATAASLATLSAAAALSTQVDALEAAAIAIEADTQDIQSRLPAALVSGRMDSSVGAMAADVLTAAAIAASAGTELAAAVWAFAHESGRTAKGVLVRLDATMTGKATGLLGTVFALFRADGTTKAVEATQDVDAGTRDTATTVAGD